MPTYPAERLAEEAAFVAYHFHWSLQEILEMEHAERLRWAGEISRINERMNEEDGAMLKI